MSARTAVKSIQDIMRKDVGVDGDAQRISQLCWMFFLKIIGDQDEELELFDDSYESPIPPDLEWRNWAADPEGMTGDELIAFVNGDLFPRLKALPTAAGPRAKVVRSVFEDAYNYMKSGQLMRQVINKINEIDFNNLTERQHFGDIYEQILNDLQSAGNAGEYYTPRAVTSFMVQQTDPRPGETLLDPACGTGGFLTCAMRHMRERYVKRPEDETLMQASLRATEKKPLPHMLAVTNMLLHGVQEPSFVRHDNTLARPYVSWGSADRVDIVVTNPPFGGREEDGIESNFPQQFRTRETADLFLALIIRLLKPGGRAAVVLPDGTLFGEGVKTRLKEHLMEECNLHTIVRLPNSVFRPYASIGTNLLFFEKGEPTRDIWFWEHRVPEGQKAYSMTKPIRLEHLDDCAAWWGGPKREGREEGPRAWRVPIRAIIDDACVRAQPHWSEADRLAARESGLRARIRAAQEAIDDLDAAGGSSDDRRKIAALRDDIGRWRSEAAEAAAASRAARAAGDSIYGAAFNLDFKNPHAVEEDHGDAEALLGALDKAEGAVTVLRGQLKAILAEALAR
jgi:type I restriction enzyme M protein